MYLAWAVVIFGAVVTAALEEFQQQEGREETRIIKGKARIFTLRDKKNKESAKKLLQKEQK